MYPSSYVSPPDREWELRPLVIIASDDAAAAAVAGRMTGAKKTHFGLFKGWLGNLGDAATAIAVADGAEGPTYAALRQMCFLFHPQAVLYVGGATATTEDLRPGDMVWVREARRCFHPLAVADNMFTDDTSLFNSPELRANVLDAPPMRVDAKTLEALRTRVLAGTFAEALQLDFPGIIVGSSERSPARFRGLELARGRFAVEVVDTGTYGFLSAQCDEGLPGSALLQVRTGCSSEYPAEFKRRTRRFHSLLGRVAEKAAVALLDLARLSR